MCIIYFWRQSIFNQSAYVNHYIKENYKTIKLRVRKDDEEVIKKIESVGNVNQYLISLIRMDVAHPRKYHCIDDSVKIDFPLSPTMQNLIDRAEEADLHDDYGLYMNLADAIDSQGKLEATRHLITNGQWMALLKRYTI